MYPRKIPRSFVVPIIHALLTIYEDVAPPDERFSATVARLGTEAFFPTIAQMLDGTPVALPQIRAEALVVIGNGKAGSGNQPRF
jgi:dissimilatory sulfite reductase (desulfoviridin) alpha/beta subunit